MSKFDQVANSDDFEQQDPTPITDLGSLFKAVEDVKKTSKQLTDTARSTSEQVIIVRTRQEDFGHRLARIERNGHPCIQKDAVKQLQEQSKIWQEDKEQGIKTRDMVKQAQVDITAAVGEITKAKKAPAKILRAVLMTGVGMVITVIGVAWFLATSLSDVQSAIVTEGAVREAQLAGIKEHINALPRKDDTPTKAQFKTVETFIRTNGHSFEARCQRLSKSQKVYLKRQVKSGALPPEMLCPE